MNRFDHCLNTVLKHEGGYVNHTRDPGGRTNLGITQRTLEAWLGEPVNEQHMRNLTVDDVRPIYGERFWSVVRADQMPVGIDLAVFDFAVNAGPRTSVRLLQRVIGVSADGLVGPITLSTLAQFVHVATAETVIVAHCDLRRDYYRSLDTFDTFGRGWLRRTDEVQAQALADIK